MHQLGFKKVKKVKKVMRTIVYDKSGVILSQTSQYRSSK